MSNYYGRRYPKRGKQATFQAVHAATGATLLLTLGLIYALKGCQRDDTVEVNLPEPTVLTDTVPEMIEEVAPTIVIPNYRSLLSMDEREALDHYLNQDESHTCDDFEAKGLTTTDHLRLRKGPGTDYDIITELNDDVSLQILGVCDNDWYLVNTGSQIGFVSGEFLRVLTPEYLESQNVQPSTHFLKAVCATEGVNVRDNPNSDTAEIIGGLAKNQSAAVLQKMDNGWYKIQYQNREGYVCGDYVNEIYATSLEELPLIYIREDAPLSSQPYENSEGSISSGQFVRIYGENDDYFLIQYNGNYCYVPKENCERMSDYYAIVDISDQTLKVYHLGEEILSTRVVTGKDSTPTRIGFFSIYSKLDHTTMVGDDYNIEMDNVLYFDGGIALHPMNRGEYDYTYDVYHVNGSHGCVNTPPNQMQKVYSYLNVGDRVFVQE